MFDHLQGMTGIRIRVECMLYATDDEHPIRLVVLGENDELLTELKFTPATADDTASSMAILLGKLMPKPDSWKIASGLRNAAIKVRAARN